MTPYSDGEIQTELNGARLAQGLAKIAFRQLQATEALAATLAKVLVMLDRPPAPPPAGQNPLAFPSKNSDDAPTVANYPPEGSAEALGPIKDLLARRRKSQAPEISTDTPVAPGPETR